MNTLTDAEKTEIVKAKVLQAGIDIREKYPLLKKQNLLGALILAFSLAGMVASGYLYYISAISAWLCIPLVAFFASLTHELEHDLIHWMYFRKKPWAHHLMMILVWCARPSTINPWMRRHLHFAHHKHSGTNKDIEERAITNGEPWGIRRFIMTGDGILSILLRMHKAPTWKLRGRMIYRGLLAYFPLGWVHWGSWYVFLYIHGSQLLAGTPLPEWAPTLNFWIVVLIAPNVLRSFCLHFVSSNMHYFGDVEDGNVVQQTQVLNTPWMIPFQLFCFNFGSTHGIHHFVVKEPFYIRQLTVKTGHAALREAGVRFNDTGTFARANRYGSDFTQAPA